MRLVNPWKICAGGILSGAAELFLKTGKGLITFKYKNPLSYEDFFFNMSTQNSGGRSPHTASLGSTAPIYVATTTTHLADTTGGSLCPP